MAVKKKWFEIVAPEQFGAAVVGETPAVDAKQLVGRTVDISLMEISRDYSNFYIKLLLQIDRIEGNKAFTKLVGHDTIRERIYRMVQRYARRVDVIQDITTKDGQKVRLKTVFVLIRRVGTSIKDSSRAEAKKLIEDMVKKKTLDELIQMIISGDIQKTIKKNISKIYPVGNVEIRKSKVME